MDRRPDRYYGEEAGPYRLPCVMCGATFDSPTGFGLYCIDCRVGIINALPMRRGSDPVYLDCQGSPSCGPWAPHVFVRRDVVRESVGNKFTEKTFYKLVYGCSLCGAEREYGFNDER